MNDIIEVTKSAQQQIKKILLLEKSNYFRITVLGGGCAGFQYKFDFSEKPNEIATPPGKKQSLDGVLEKGKLFCQILNFVT